MLAFDHLAKEAPVARLSHLRLATLASALLLGSLAAACGSSGETGSSGTAGSGNASGSGGSTGGSAGSVGTGCDPACVDPQICSVAGSCIDPGQCLENGDCDAGLKCDTATKTCVPGGDCGGQEAKADPVAPNLLIVLDRSCSMTDNV